MLNEKKRKQHNVTKPTISRKKLKGPATLAPYPNSNSELSKFRSSAKCTIYSTVTLSVL